MTKNAAHPLLKVVALFQIKHFPLFYQRQTVVLIYLNFCRGRVLGGSYYFITSLCQILECQAFSLVKYSWICLLHVKSEDKLYTSIEETTHLEVGETEA